MPHPFSTHRNGAIIIVAGHDFGARMSIASGNFSVSISVRRGEYPRYAYCLGNCSFNKAYLSFLQLMRYAGCGEAAKEHVHEDWCEARDAVFKVTDKVVTIGDDWPTLDVASITKTLARKATQGTTMMI